MTDPRTHTPRLQASDRRLQLVETALDFFSRKGFSGTTTKEIAAAAGVTEAIIFRHFPTKQDLYALLRELAAEGNGIVLFSTEIEELVDLCNRIAVLRFGGIYTVVEEQEMTSANVLAAMASATVRIAVPVMAASLRPKSLRPKSLRPTGPAGAAIE